MSFHFIFLPLNIVLMWDYVVAHDFLCPHKIEAFKCSHSQKNEAEYLLPGKNWGQEISFATLSCFCKSGYVFPAVHIKTEAHSSLIHNLRSTTGCHWNGRILGKKCWVILKEGGFVCLKWSLKASVVFGCCPWVVWHFIHILPLWIYLFFFLSILDTYIDKPILDWI